jgi:uncharacterized RDD family membrane protein YckC
MNQNTHLAGRGRRFGAQLIDWLILIGPTTLFFIAMGLAGQFDKKEPSALAIAGMAISGIWMWTAIIWNLVLLGRHGQTFGKKMLGIQIRRQDGSEATFGTVVGMRLLLNALICAIPILGAIYALVDVLFIFREDRSCLHDQIAKTMVVDLGSEEPYSALDAPSFGYAPERTPTPRVPADPHGSRTPVQPPSFPPSPSVPIPSPRVVPPPPIVPPTRPTPPPLPGTQASTKPPASPQPAALDQLEKLAGLKDRGILTEDEFTAEKRKLLGI